MNNSVTKAIQLQRS